MNYLKKSALSLIPTLLLISILIALPSPSAGFQSNLLLNPEGNSYFPFLEAIMGYIILLPLISFLCLNSLAAAFKRFNKESLFLLLVFPILSVFCSYALSTMGHKLFFDEEIYISIAENIYRFFDFRLPYEMVFKSEAPQVVLALPDKHPLGFSLILSIISAFKESLGLGYDVYFLPNQIFLFFNSTLISLLTLRLTRSSIAALASALIFSLSPITIFWHSSVSSEAFTVTLILASIFYLFESLENYSSRFYKSLFILAAAGCAYLRPEGLMYSLILSMAADHLNRRKLPIYSLSVILLAMPMIFRIYLFQDHSWGNSSDSLFSFSHLFQYLPSNLFISFSANNTLSITSLLLGIWGFIFLSKRKSPLNLILKLCPLVLFFLTVVFYSAFFSGNFNDPKETRFLLIAAPFISVFSAMGFSDFTDFLKRYFKKQGYFKIPTAMVFGISLFLLVILELNIRTLPIDKTGYTTIYNPRLDHEFISTADIPINSYVYSHTPWIFHRRGISSGQIDLLTKRLKNPHGSTSHMPTIHTWLHYGYWCFHGGQVQRQKCDNALKGSSDPSLFISNDFSKFYMAPINR